MKIKIIFDTSAELQNSSEILEKLGLDIDGPIHKKIDALYNDKIITEWSITTKMSSDLKSKLFNIMTSRNLIPNYNPE